MYTTLGVNQNQTSSANTRGMDCSTFHNEAGIRCVEYQLTCTDVQDWHGLDVEKGI